MKWGSAPPMQDVPLFRSVLLGEALKAQLVAWEILWAVAELFPRYIEELLGLQDLDTSDVDSDEEARDLLVTDVTKWTTKYRLDSAMMGWVAADFVEGLPPPLTGSVARLVGDGIEFPPDTLSLTANPWTESIEQFLERARSHYRAVRGFWGDEVAILRPAFRGREPFRYLVAHLVGRHSWAEIAKGDTPFGRDLLPVREQQSIAEQGRSVAAVLGIKMSTKRGPRKGAARHRRIPSGRN